MLLLLQRRPAPYSSRSKSNVLAVPLHASCTEAVALKESVGDRPLWQRHCSTNP